MNRHQLTKTRRLVVKVGSSLVTNNGAGLDENFLANLAQQLAVLRSDGREMLLVTSGAIAAGMGRLSWAVRPRELHRLQAAAAVGQVALAQAYENVFSHHRWPTAQILLTHEDLCDRTRYLNARSTLQTLLESDVLPIINENDTVVSDEIRFGDNDTLAALVTNLMEADLLVLLTDQAGLFDANPREHPQAQLIASGSAEDQAWELVAGESDSPIARGGMYTKVRAARRAARSGAHTLIAAGHEPQVLSRLLAGEDLGTLLCASLPPLAARKQWLADHLKLAGSLVLDEGAVRALSQGRSLLPVGVKKVVGTFQRGAPVQCVDQAGQEVARGLVNYSSTEVGVLAGHPSREIEELLGYVGEAEVIHRNNLVMN